MNNSTESIPSSMASIGLSDIELWIQLVVFYLLIGGLAATAGNICVFFGIIRYRQKLRTRFFAIIACLSLVRTLICSQTAFMASYRILRTLRLASFDKTRSVCHGIHFFLYTQQTAELLILIVLVVDRLMAVVALKLYGRMTVGQAAWICASVIALTVAVKLPLTYAIGGRDLLTEQIQCVNTGSPIDPVYNVYAQNVDLALVLALVAAYLLLIVVVRRRTKVAKAAGNSRVSNSGALAMKKQEIVLRATRNVVILHCTFTLTTKIIQTVASTSLVDAQTSARLVAYGGMFNICDEFVNVLVLLLGHDRLRSASIPKCAKFFTWSRVTPVKADQQEKQKQMKMVRFSACTKDNDDI